MSATRLLHPNQFDVNEAWIAFRINNAPIRTELDGDFNCMALMDAASCFILCSGFIPVAAAEPTQAEFRRMLADAKRHKQQLPKTLFVPREALADRITLESAHHGIDVVRVPEGELLIFIGEAREAFAERFEDDS